MDPERGNICNNNNRIIVSVDTSRQPTKDENYGNVTIANNISTDDIEAKDSSRNNSWLQMHMFL